MVQACPKGFELIQQAYSIQAEMSKNYKFLLDDIEWQLVFSCRNRVKPYIVTPHNAY